MQTKTKAHLNAFKSTPCLLFFFARIEVNNRLQYVQMTPHQQPALSDHKMKMNRQCRHHMADLSSLHSEEQSLVHKMTLSLYNNTAEGKGLTPDLMTLIY